MSTTYNLLFWILLGLLLFFVVNWVGKHSKTFGYEELSKLSEVESSNAFNFIFRVATPLVSLIIISTVLYALHFDPLIKNIHYSIFAYIFIRLGFNWMRGRLLLLNWPKLVLQWFVLLGGAFLVYEKIIKTKEYLVPDIKTVGNEVWLGIVAYLYVLSNQIRPDERKQEMRTNKFIQSKIDDYTAKFGPTIKNFSQNERFQALVYSVMLIEDFNRPKAYRCMENLLFRVGKAKTLGIMQTSPNRIVTDEESVVLGMEVLQKSLNSTFKKPDIWAVSQSYRERYEPSDVLATEERKIIHHVLTIYNHSGDYAREVESIFDHLINSMFKQGNLLHPTLTETF